MKVLISTSAKSDDPIKKAQAEIADYKKQIDALQKKIATAQRVIDNEVSRIKKVADTAALQKAKEISKDVLFFGVTADGKQSKATKDFNVAARFAIGRGKVYALKDAKKTAVAYWDSKNDNGHPIKGYRLHFTAAGKKYAALYKR